MNPANCPASNFHHLAFRTGPQHALRACAPTRGSGQIAPARGAERMSKRGPQYAELACWGGDRGPQNTKRFGAVTRDTRTSRNARALLKTNDRVPIYPILGAAISNRKGAFLLTSTSQPLASTRSTQPVDLNASQLIENSASSVAQIDTKSQQASVASHWQSAPACAPRPNAIESTQPMIAIQGAN